jgi:pimeloyl-ACP methyl ester carboxylesterase
MSLPLIALPGTLLDGRSLQAMLSLATAGRLNAEIVILGQCAGLDEEIDRLAALPTGPAVWLGHSLGGICALHLAMRHPHRAAGLVLLAASPRADSPAGAERRAAHWQEAQNHGLAALARSSLAPDYGLAADDPLTRQLVEQAEAVGLRRLQHQFGYAAQRPGVMAPRKALPWPMLALSAEHDALCPPALSDELVALSPRGTHHLLPGGHHLFPMQAPGWVASHVSLFLEQLQEPPPCA